MELFRPTGQRELQLVFEAGMRAWPPRLPEQPIFYPVTNQAYADEIAEGWNSRDDGGVGYTTSFEVDDSYASRFERRVVGSSRHEELWVPAEELPAFNAALLGHITVESSFFGPGFCGLVPGVGPLAGADALGQARLLQSDEIDLTLVLRDHAAVVFTHWPFWSQQGYGRDLVPLKRIWTDRFPTIPLPEMR